MEIQEPALKEFCETHNLENLIDEPTCYNNPLICSRIDLILTNRSKRKPAMHESPKTCAFVPAEIIESSSLLQFKNKIKEWEPIGCMCRICKTYVNNFINFIIL